MELERLYQDLSVSEQKFKTVADYTSNWEYWINPSGRLEWMSRACQKVTGYAEEEFFKDQHLLESITHPEDATIIRDHLISIGSNAPCTEEIEFRIIHRDGTVRQIQHTCQSVHDASGNYLGRRSANRDVTSQKQAEKEKHYLQAQMLQSAKLASIGTLAAGVAHEINNPLTILLGNLSVLVEQVPIWMKPEFRERFDVLAFQKRVQHMEEAGNRIAAIIGTLLNYSRGDCGTYPCAVDLNQCVVETVAFCKTLLQKSGVEVVCDLAPERPFIVGNIGCLNQVVMNLLTNARDAMDSVTGERKIVIRTRCQGDLSQLIVSDDGAGIPGADVTKIFDPFFSTKSPGKGTGLGLSIVHTIISKWEGSIEVQSKPGEGATFTVSLKTAAALPKASSQKCAA